MAPSKSLSRCRPRSTKRFPAEKRRRRRRDDDLPTVRERRDPRAAMNVDADVTLARDVRRPRVQPHAHADRPGRQIGPTLNRSSGRALRRRERDEERVALGIYLDPVMGSRTPRE